jgi:hypothetical protein
MLRGTSRGLRDRGGDWSGAPLRKNDAVDARAVRCAKKRSKVMRIFDTIKSKEELVLARLLRDKKVFDRKKLSLPHDRQNALVGIGASEPGKLVAGFEGDADTGCSAELDQPFQAIVATFAGDTDMIELA